MQEEQRHRLLASHPPYSDSHLPGRHLIQKGGIVSREWKNRQESRLAGSPVTTKHHQVDDQESEEQIGREAGTHTRKSEEKQKQRREKMRLGDTGFLLWGVKARILDNRQRILSWTSTPLLP